MQALTYCFAPRPIRLLERDGWKVLVQDEVTGCIVVLSADREPTRHPRSDDTPLFRAELFYEYGEYRPRAPIVDGYRVQWTDNAEQTTYRLTKVGGGTTHTLAVTRSLDHLVERPMAIRNQLVLVVPDAGDRVEAFDVSTGTLRWSSTFDSVAGVGFIGDVPAACNEGQLVAFDRDDGSVSQRLDLPTHGETSLHSGDTGVFVHHDRGVLFVDKDGLRPLVEELVSEPRCSVAGSAWCRWDDSRTRVAVGTTEGRPCVLTFDSPPVELWMDRAGLAWSGRSEVGFVPLQSLAAGELRPRAVRIVDPSPPVWEPATVVVASKSFSIVKDRWGRRTLGWKNAPWQKGETIELADFEHEYAGDEHPDRVATPTRLRHGRTEAQLDTKGAPLRPVSAEPRLGTVAHFVRTEHEVPPVIARLIKLDLIAHNAAIDQLVAAGVDNAASALMHVYGYGAEDGLEKGVVTYDHRFLNDTEDPAADFARLAADVRVAGRTTSIEDDSIVFTMTIDGTKSAHELEIDEEFLERLRGMFNDALRRVGAQRRIYDVYAGADYFTFLGCSPEVARQLRSVGVELGGP